jgi:hypothetical protein
MKNRVPVNFWEILSAILAVVVLLLWHTPAGIVKAADDGIEYQASGGIATLYAMDPITQSLCIADGRAGHVFQEHQVRNRCSDLDFNSYKEAGFSAGVEGGRLGNIIDLGDGKEMSRRYGYLETTDHGKGFASLNLQGGKVVVLKDYKSTSLQPLSENALLFQEGKPGASAPVALGHIYLVRLTDHFDKSFQRLVKFIVLAYSPGQSVTIRWQVL